MTENQIKLARLIRTAGPICPAYAGAKTKPFFYGAKMIALTSSRSDADTSTAKRVKSITNNLRFYNQIAIKISLYHSEKNRIGAAPLYEGIPNVRAFALSAIDNALKQEMDRELAVMARGENVAANQRRQRVLGKYLLSKPYSIIKNFYGVGMQQLAVKHPAESHSESNAFYSDIVHERTDKTVYSSTRAQIERAAAPSAAPAVISDGDLNRIAAQAAKQVERKMRTERERNGKW